MYRGGVDPDWTYGKSSGDVFNPKGDHFIVRSDATGIFGGRVRAGFPNTFSFNPTSRIMSWTYIWKDEITPMQSKCTKS